MKTENKKPKVDWRVMIAGMVCLTAIQIFALSQGVNGKLMAMISAIIALAIGVTIPLDKFIKH